MKIVRVVIISISIVAALGIFIVFQPYLPQKKPAVELLFFDIKDEQNLPQWCDNLSSMLQEQNIPATIFITGQVAQEYPSCVNELAKRNDIGSLTYDYFNLTGQDYAIQLDEVKNGKDTIDAVGHMDTRLFKAPYGETDDNTEDVLNQSGILVDFSKDTQYTEFYDGKSLKFYDLVYNATGQTPDFFSNLSFNEPVIIDFDNTTPVDNINEFISQLQTKHLHLLNASELTGIELTVRNENKT